MLLSSIAVIFIGIAAIANGQRLEVLEQNRICTAWQLITGSNLVANIDLSPCSGNLGYELRDYSNIVYVRFCCPYRQTTTPAVGPPPNGCGRQAVPPLRTRIVGGQEAVPHSWPWLVSLQQYGGHFCGGTLIDEYHVVTAAHCLQDDDVMDGFTIVAGLHTRSRPDPQRVQRRQVARIFNHEYYNDDTNYNDIAVIRLASPVQLNSYVNVVCLPGNNPGLNEKVMIAGWGTTTYEGSSPDSLRQANILIMDNCREVYDFDAAKQICAGNYQYTKDSCQGDSGGPLMYEANGQWILSGVVSYGDECAKQDRPGVYARVSHYLPWIRSKVASP
jgi:secreted trypsin-like serine protease